MINKKCFFLNQDNSCRIQTQFNYDSKPEVCKNFPYNEVICGIPELTEKKQKKIKTKERDYFFKINKKLIESNIFLKNIKDLDTSNSLFESYLNLIRNILNQESKLIYEDLKIENKPFKISKRLNHRLEEILFLLSKDLFPGYKKFFKKDINIKFPTRNIKVNLKKTDLPENLKKKFLDFLYDILKEKQPLFIYPVFLIFILYFLPNLANSIKENQEVEFKDIILSFSILNSLNNFSHSGLDLREIQYINEKLDKFLI
jgi:hypothetical protein